MKKLTPLLEIKKPEDIKSFAIESIEEDDNALCAECKINGIDIEFLWYDTLGFLEYWNESKKAFKELQEAIQHSVELEED
jgi:hypothetical protein